MLRQICKSKIHRVTVTQADVDYEGSITIDRTLMDAANLLPFERVQVASIRTGARLETYVIEGQADSGMIGMNGAAARLIHEGDEIHIISYASMQDDEAMRHQPTVVHVDQENKVVEIVQTP